MEARQLLRNKLDVLSKDEIVKDYLRKDGKLSDLSLPTAEAKRQACRAIGAAYAEEYQPLLADTGWIRMENSGSGTDTQGLFSARSGISCPYRGISIPHAGTAATGAASWPSSRTRYSPRDTACAAAPLTGTMTTSTTGALVHHLRRFAQDTALRARYVQCQCRTQLHLFCIVMKHKLNVNGDIESRRRMRSAGTLPSVKPYSKPFNATS